RSIPALNSSFGAQPKIDRACWMSSTLMGDTYPKRHHGTQDLCRIERFDRLLTSVCRTIILMIMQPFFSVFLRGVDGFFVIALLMFFAGCNPAQHDTAAASPAPGPGVASI